MAHLYAIKMIGLIILLAIALALPRVLPKPETRAQLQSGTITNEAPGPDKMQGIYSLTVLF